MTFAEEIEGVTGEAIEFAVIGGLAWDYGKVYKLLGLNYEAQESVRGRCRPWAEVRHLLEYERETGFGSPAPNAVYAWTKSYVLFLTKYDGSSYIARIPRNPVDCYPFAPGGEDD